ncbi:MAG TPA: glycosyltransferase [Flavipsychrobacter sp.]|nr:glycosyltransferase [Flavipsychrobacter sp.]
MKLLFLANRIPYPPYRGDKLKIYNLAKRLCKKHELHLLTFTETENDKTYIDELKNIFGEIHTVHLPQWRAALHVGTGLFSKIPLQVAYFQSAEMKRVIARQLAVHHYDAIHVQHLRMAPYLQERKDLSCILDLPDAFSLYWKRRQEVEKNTFRNAFERFEQRRLERFEAIIKDYKLSLVCSQEDLEYLEKKHHTCNLKLLPNGVDTTTFFPKEHDYAKNDVLLFTGNMDYAPNVDAVCYFVEEVLPLIHQQFPKVKFVIAGQRPVEKVKVLASENVKVTGFVEDLSEMYNAASVVVAPLRFGAGTQNKVLEAMAMGVPVVCTQVGFKGLGVESGDGVFMQVGKQAFADQVCELLESEQLRTATGKKGTEVIRRKFDWDVIAGQLEGYFEEVQKL